MRVSCIVTLPAQAALRNSAAAAFTANPLGFAMDAKPDKAGLIIDETFSPLPIPGVQAGDRRVGYSSQGPGIPGMAPAKPDGTAYTHFLGSEAFGAGVADSGTSTACPVAAGCVAALRTRLAPAREPPASLFATIRAQALGKPGPGWNADYGTGIIQPVPVARVYGL